MRGIQSIPLMDKTVSGVNTSWSNKQYSDSIYLKKYTEYRPRQLFYAINRVSYLKKVVVEQ